MDRQIPFYLQLKNEREKRGWAQADLAKKIGTDFKTVYRWESGKSMPRPYYRQRLVEILGKSLSELGLVDQKEIDTTIQQIVVHEDWGEAPIGKNFYGRHEELTQVIQWINGSGCRIVALLGIGGIGKTTLTARVAMTVKDQFQYVFWRSLQNMPPVQQVLKAVLECLSDEEELQFPETLDEQYLLLLKYMRKKRCLVVLDNFESIMQRGWYAGNFQQEYLGYEKLLRLIGEANHQSCLLITSREKPKEVALLEGEEPFVRSLFLKGVGCATGRELLQEKALVGSDEQWAMLVDTYSGNPLALKLISETVREVFNGDLGSFLREGEIVFGDVSFLVGHQLERLSEREKEILYWLAIEREPIILEQIYDNLVRTFSRGEVLAALESLKRRFLLESRGANQITLQPVIMEYMTQNLVKRACEEFGNLESITWTHYAFAKAQSKDYIREIQQRVILSPVLEYLCNTLGKQDVVHKLHMMLSNCHISYAQQRSYLAANILHALVYLRSELQGLDFSHLEIRQAYLQFTKLQNVNFNGSHFIKTVFKNTFGNVLSVAFHPSDEMLAIGTASGDIWIYQIRSATPLLVCSGHTDATWSVAFHPDGNLLASCSDDSTIRLWSVDTGTCVRVLKGHENRVRSVAFSPNGLILASGGEDHILRIWQVDTGECLFILAGHTDRIWSVAFHPEGKLIASGSTDQTIRLWDVQQQRCVALFEGHTNWVRVVAFSPDGQVLASGSDDMSIRLWKHDTGECLKRIEGHIQRIWFLTYSIDGTLLASGGENGAIRVWHAHTGIFLRELHEHVQGIRALAFNANSELLVSGGEDQTLRLWDCKTGDCLKTVQGYTNRIWSISCSSDGGMVASSSEDKYIRVWNVEKKKCVESIMELIHGARAIVWSPDQNLLASGGEDQIVHIWSTQTGTCLQRLQGHTAWIRTLAWSPDQKLLASGGEDQTIRLWNMNNDNHVSCYAVLHGHTSWVRSVCFNTEGTVLASGGDDHTVRIWQVGIEQCETIFQGHKGRVRSVAFHTDGRLVASGSEDGTIRVWDMKTKQCQQTLYGHLHWVHAVAFSPHKDLLASCGDDLTIRLWDLQTGQCIWIGRGHTARIRSLCFHPSGALLISGGDDGTIKFWQPPEEVCITNLSSARPYECMLIEQATGLTEAQRATLLALGAIGSE